MKIVGYTRISPDSLTIRITRNCCVKHKKSGIHFSFDFYGNARV